MLKIGSLLDDNSKYLQTFELLLANSAEHQDLKNYINTTIQCNTLHYAHIGAGEPILNVMGVGSGSGELDLEILKVLHEKHPDTKLENEVVEPSNEMLNNYKALLVQTPGLDYVNFRWNAMTATEFENKWKKRNFEKQMHFISMIEMLYYVEDVEATLSFYQSLLHKDGKILLVLAADDSAWTRLGRAFTEELCRDGINQNLTSGEVKSFLDSRQIPYQIYKFHTLLDITECFIPEDEKGELLLDLLTEVVEFSKNAPPELKDGVLEFLKSPDNSHKVNSRILFNCNSEALLIDA